MQISKNHIKRNITNAALKLFKAKDYSSVSMREIASEAQVGLSNIYNYFRSKDELFCHIVQPAVSSFERMLEEHHGYEGKDIMEMQSEKYLLYTVSEYLKIINKHGEEISILFFKANGSSLHIGLAHRERLPSKAENLLWYALTYSFCFSSGISFRSSTSCFSYCMMSVSALASGSKELHLYAL